MADFELELNSLTIDGGDYTFEGPIGGLGTPEARTVDSERGDRDGDVGGADVLQRRTLTIPVAITEDDPDDAWTLLDDLKAAFRVTAADQELTLTLPGLVGTTYFGRPRGVEVDLEGLGQGVIRALCTFVCLDPVGYGDEVTETAGASITVTNAGTYVTDRVELTVAASGTPTISGENGSIVFADSFSGTRVINLRDRTVTDGSGTDCYPEVAASSTWFTVLPGANTIATSTGTVAATFRPAYL